MSPKSAEESFQIFEFEIKNLKVSDEFIMGFFKILQKNFKTYQKFRSILKWAKNF
jgi:phage terminase large subunit